MGGFRFIFGTKPLILLCFGELKIFINVSNYKGLFVFIFIGVNMHSIPSNISSSLFQAFLKKFLSELNPNYPD
jgi:hypothetical protein